ncbi:MAG: NRDE family protein [Acidisphaera sp.]|nr:NRDE family protein [Acidisphaera sp.]
MCTVVLLARPGHAWPLLLAANRDEMLERVWDPPGTHWPELPDVVAGRDRSGGGTWLGLNRQGVVAAVLNRPGSLGPMPGKRSRGELPLLGLAHASAAAAAGAMAGLDARAWRSFNMVLADRTEAFFVRGLGAGSPQVQRLAPGLHMITARDPDDMASPRVARHLPGLRAAPPPEPPDDWAAWRTLIADRSGAVESQINVVPHAGFGTVCSSLIGLSAGGEPLWLFAPGPPDRTEFAPVPLRETCHAGQP